MKDNNLIDIYNKLIKKANFKKEAYGTPTKYSLQLLLNGLSNAVQKSKLSPAQAAKMADVAKMRSYFKGGSRFGKNINRARFNNVNSNMGSYYEILNTLPAKERKAFLDQIANLEKQYANINAKVPVKPAVAATPKAPIEPVATPKVPMEPVATPKAPVEPVAATPKAPVEPSNAVEPTNGWWKTILAGIGGFGAGAASVPAIFGRDYSGITPEQTRSFFQQPEPNNQAFDPKF